MTVPDNHGRLGRNLTAVDAPVDQAVQTADGAALASGVRVRELSEIAELLSDSPLREQMKNSTDAAALHALITGWQSAHAAA